MEINLLKQSNDINHKENLQFLIDKLNLKSLGQNNKDNNE